MYIAIVILHVLVSLVIIGLVLLQAGKGADIGSAFGGTGSQAVFGSMSTPTVLGKLTTAVAVLFMLTSFSLSMLAHKRSASIMPATAPATAPGAGSVHRARAGRAAGTRDSARRRTVHAARAGAGHEVGCGRAGAWSHWRWPARSPRRPDAGEMRPAWSTRTSAMAGAPAYGDTFIEATIGDIAGLIPNITSDGASHEVGNMVYDGLVKVDKDLNYVGAMAESWQFSAGLSRADLEAEAQHQVARRPAVHGRGRAVHLPDDDQSEDADGVQGGLPRRQACGGGRSAHLPRDVCETAGQGRAELGHVDAAQASAREVRGGRQAEGVAGEQPPCRHRAVPVPGVEERREGGAGRQPRLLRGSAVSRPHRVSRDPEPGHHLPGAEGEGRRPGLPDGHPVLPADGVPRVSQGLHEVPLPVERVHVLRVQPEGSALRRPAGAPGVRARDQQAGADRGRADGARPRGDGAHPPRELGVHRQGRPVRLRSGEGEGPPR